MYLSGIHVDGETLFELAKRLRKVGRADLADWFEVAYERDIPALELTPFERDAIIDELEGVYEELAEFRNELARDHRVRA